MARLHVMERSHAQAVMDDLHDALGRRLAVSSLAPCPVEFTAALVNLCSTQSCGKCTPCRVGLSALSDLLADVLEGRADESTLNLIERTARTIYLSSDCAIGYEAGAMALTAIRGFRDDFEHHIREHSCGFDREARVPCVSGCPAHVDIPGYISLVEAGPLCRCRQGHPQEQPAAARLRFGVRASLRDALPSRHGRRSHEHPRPQAFCR